MCSTTRRLLAVLTFGFLGSVLAFAVGARVGAALDGGVHAMTLARTPIARFQVREAQASLAR